MSLTKCVSSVKTLNGYASLTEDLSRQDYNVPFNIGTCLSLKKIRSFEIDYFTKYKENGAAFVLIKRLLKNPASKTWGLLGKEIASLLQYWLEGVKKYLIVYCPQWWLFMKSLLDFINDFIPKDPSISNALVKSSSESLLELACIETLNVDQRLQLLVSLGQLSEAASCLANKELVHGLQKQYSVHFTKLGSLFLTCDVALQYAVLELFIRWGVRPALPRPAADVLAERRFIDFYKDSRELLNALNKSVQEITSFPCKKMTLGEVDICATTQLWLDISCQYRRLSAILPPPASATLLVRDDDALSVTLQRDELEVLISIVLAQPPYILRGHIEGISDKPGQTLKITISMDNLKNVNTALKTAFKDKYENQLDIGDVSYSMESTKVTATSQDNAKWSQPPVRNRYGIKVRQSQQGWQSPSTASTTSLAQLHEKLAAFPRLRSDREFPTVCAQPDLSIVSEISEYDDVYKKQGCVSRKKNRKAITSPSDEERIERKFLSSPNRCPNRSASTSPNCLLTSTIAPLDRTDPEHNRIIDQILKEAFQKDDLLDSGINTDKNSSQVPDTKPVAPNVKNVTVISKSSSEEHSMTVKEDSRIVYSKDSNKDSKIEAYKSTTTDESNTEAINDTPHCYVNIRRKPKQVERNFKEIGDLQPVAVDDMLEFFEQHLNTAEDLPISPTLARKINASSDSSESFDQIINESQKMNEIRNDDDLNLNADVADQFDDVNDDVANPPHHDIEMVENTTFEVYENDVLGCLASLIDKVCEDLDKCADITDQEVVIQIIEAEERLVKKEKAPKKSKMSKMPKIKLAFKNTTAKKAKKPAKSNKLELEVVAEESPETAKPEENIADKNIRVDKQKSNIQEMDEITEQPTEMVENTEPRRITEGPTFEDPNTRRKRKLYSPNDDSEIQELETTEIEDKPENKLKTTATSYKDIEKDRKIFRRSRNRKSNSEPKSPRTLKNDNLFESLKVNIGNAKDLVLVDVGKKTRDKKMAVYNYSSSDEDDFKQTKAPVNKSASLETKRKRIVKSKTMKATSEEPQAKEPKKQQNKRAKKPQVAKTLAKNVRTLEDERMREAIPEVLEQSFIVEEPQEAIETPKKVTKRSMEGIPVDDPDVIENTAERNVKILKIKKEKGLKKQKVQEQKRKSKSPEEELPPLIIEEMAKDDRSSTSSRFAKKIQKIMRDGCIDETNTTHDLLDRQSSPDVQTEIQIINTKMGFDDTRNENEKSRNNIEEIQFIDDEKENIHTRNNTKKSVKKTREIELNDNAYEHEAPKTKKTKNSKKVVGEIQFTDNENNATRNKTSAQSDDEPLNTMKTKKSDKAIEQINLIDNENKNKGTKNKFKKILENSNKIDAKDSNIKNTKAKKCPPIETVDITSCDQSERSIATCHGNSPITAHGDIDEAPPSPEMLNQVYSPRNLDTQDLYAKEYKQQLRKGIRYQSSDSKSSKNTQKMALSPVVSIERLSPEVIRNKLKSRNKRYDSKSSEASNDTQKIAQSPALSIKRLSQEDISKWLPSPKSSITGDAEVEMINFNPKKSLEKGVEKYSKIRKDRMVSNTDKNEKTFIGETEVNNSTEESSSESQALTKFKGTVRKSIISPIIDFDKFLPTFIGPEEMTKLSEKSKSECNFLKRQETSTSESSNIPLVMKRLPQLDEVPRKIRKIYCPAAERSPKSDETLRVIKDASPSSESTERVRQWLQRTVSSKQDEDKHGMCKDCMKYVIEKIDTTLLEIHHDTNERWMNVLVEQEISQRKMIKEIVEKFEEMYQKLSAETRARAAAALERDCARKRAFLTALISDLKEKL